MVMFLRNEVFRTLFFRSKSLIIMMMIEYRREFIVRFVLSVVYCRFI